MRRLPSHLPRYVTDLIRWADACQATPLAADRVPGADGVELSRLAALGALARALAPHKVETWPESLASWARDADVVVDDAVVAAVREALGDTGKDVLAIAYEYVVSGVNRRQLGTFFTPAPIVRYMIDQSKRMLSGPPAHVIDPGAGVGAFSLAALDAWRSARVTAVDVNVVTLGLLAARAAGRGRSGSAKTNRLMLAPADYLAWLQEEWRDLNGPRLILGNPPYTRHQRMTEKDKEAARKVAGDLITSGLAGLSAYFLAATLNALSPHDSVSFLLPASWCETRYGREIREWLWRARKRRVEVHFFPSDVDVFPGTQVAAMILLIGPTKRAEQPFLTRQVDLPGGDSGAAVTLGRIVEPDRSGGCPPTFTGLLRRPAGNRLRAAVPLGDVARVRRGVATGASEFFFVSDAQRDKHRIPRRALRLALVKPAHCSGFRFDIETHDAVGRAGLPRWLLDLNDSSLVETDEHIKAYLAYGKELSIHLRYLTSHRPEWYLVEPVAPPDLFLVPVGKPYHRVISNEAKAVGSNNLYGIYLSDEAPWSGEALANWLRSDEGQQGLTDLARHYHGGSLKIEPRAVRTLKVPGSLAAG